MGKVTSIRLSESEQAAVSLLSETGSVKAAISEALGAIMNVHALTGMRIVTGVPGDHKVMVTPSKVLIVTKNGNKLIPTEKYSYEAFTDKFIMHRNTIIKRELVPDDLMSEAVFITL